MGAYNSKSCFLRAYLVSFVVFTFCFYNLLLEFVEQSIITSPIFNNHHITIRMVAYKRLKIFIDISSIIYMII